MSIAQTGDETRNEIREFILRQFPLARQKAIGDDDSLLHDGLIDSLGTLDVVMFLEDHFGILLDDEEMVSDNFESIATLTHFVETKLGLL